MPQPFVRPFVAIALLAASASAAFAAPPPVVAAYDAELARQCPARHLEWLNPGIAADPMDDFTETLDRSQRAVAKADYARHCAHVEAGATCGNVSTIRTAARLGLTARLAGKVCALPVACTAPFVCAEIRR